MLAYYNVMQNLVKNKIKLASQVGLPNLVEEYVVLAFKFMIENKIFTDESFRLGIELGKIRDHQSFCDFYDFQITNEQQEAVISKPFSIDQFVHPVKTQQQFTIIDKTGSE